MTEQPDQHDLAVTDIDDDGPSSADVTRPTTGGALRTGNPRVDAVLDSLEQLAEESPDEHVPVFERAHEELRRALDALPDHGAEADGPGGDAGPEGG